MSEFILAKIVHSLSPEGRGWGEGARAREKELDLPNPLTLAHFVRSTSPLRGEVKQKRVLAVHYARVCQIDLQMIEDFLYSLRSIRSSLLPSRCS